MSLPVTYFGYSSGENTISVTVTASYQLPVIWSKTYTFLRLASPFHTALVMYNDRLIDLADKLTS